MSYLHLKSSESAAGEVDLPGSLFLKCLSTLFFVQVEKEATKAEQDNTQVLKRLMPSSKQKNRRPGYVFAYLVSYILACAACSACSSGEMELS